MKKKLFRRSLLLLLIAVMLLSASCGKNKATTMKLIKIDGDVGVENEKGKSVDLIENLGLYNGYNVGTQTKSFAWIDFDDTKLTKMDEKSDVDIIKDGKKLELVVNSGGLFFNVTKPLEDDESMDIRTSTTICGIRGTCGWVESRGNTTYVGLLDGKVECSVTVDGKEETIKLNAKELLIVKKDGDHVTYEVKKLTSKDVPEFVQVEIADEPFAFEREISEQGNNTAVGVDQGLILTGDSSFLTEAQKFVGSYESSENGYHIIEITISESGGLDVLFGSGSESVGYSSAVYGIKDNQLSFGEYTPITLNADGSITVTGLDDLGNSPDEKDFYLPFNSTFTKTTPEAISERLMELENERDME